MADLRVFLASRMMFNASLDVEHLLTEFLNEYYGGGQVAANVKKYITLISAAFAEANHSLDFTGRVMDPLEARYLGSGPNSSVFTNHTLLTGAVLLRKAQQAAKHPEYQRRVAIDLMHLQYVRIVTFCSVHVGLICVFCFAALQYASLLLVQTIIVKIALHACVHRSFSFVGIV